jgi:hypothetical protein
LTVLFGEYSATAALLTTFDQQLPAGQRPPLSPEPADRVTSDTLECVERLTMPRYPPIAQSARVAMDDVVASVQLSAEGAVQSVSFNSPGPDSFMKLLSPSIEEIVRTAKFKRECGGRVVPLAFDFRLSMRDDDYGRVSFRYPNHFEITGTVPGVNVERARR